MAVIKNKELCVLRELFEQNKNVDPNTMLAGDKSLWK
jgi:hypothetical protein